MASLHSLLQPIEKKRKPEQPLEVSPCTPEGLRAAPTRSLIDELLAASEARIQESVASASTASLDAIKSLAESQQTTISQEFGTALRGYDEQVCGKFEEVHDKIAAMAARLVVLEESSSNQTQKVANIAKELVIMENKNDNHYRGAAEFRVRP